MIGILGSFKVRSYKDIAQQSLGKTVWFLCIVILIVSALISLKATFAINHFLSETDVFAERNLAEMVRDIPVIEIKEGHLVNPKERFVKSWKLPQEGNFTFAVEPDSSAVTPLLQENAFAVVMTNDRVYIKTTERGSVGKIQEHKFDTVAQARVSAISEGLRAEFPNAAFELTPATVSGLISKIKFFVWPVMFLIMLGIYSFTKPLQVLFFSLIALIINAATKAGLAYRGLFCVCVYAMVPPTLAAVASEFLGLAQRAGLLVVTVYFTLFVVYISLGIKQAKTAAV